MQYVQKNPKETGRYFASIHCTKIGRYLKIRQGFSPGMKQFDAYTILVRDSLFLPIKRNLPAGDICDAGKNNKLEVTKEFKRI